MKIEEKLTRGVMALFMGGSAFVSSSNFMPLWLATVISVAMTFVAWKIFQDVKIK